MSYSASDINKILKDYFKISDGKQFLQDNNISVSIYSEDEILEIARQLKQDIINEFIRLTRHGNINDARAYFDSVKVSSKVQHLQNGDKATITFTEHSLHRPSLARGEWTSGGIDDIFALITNGTSKTGIAYGYWTYWDKNVYGKNKGGYTADTIWTRACLPRIGKPFIAYLIQRCEQQHPGLKITYPKTWK